MLEHSAPNKGRIVTALHLRRERPSSRWAVALATLALLVGIPPAHQSARALFSPTAQDVEVDVVDLRREALERFKSLSGADFDEGRYDVVQVPDGTGGVVHFVLPVDTMTLFFNGVAIAGCDPSQGEPCTPEPVELPKRPELPAGDTSTVVDVLSYTVGMYAIPTGAGLSPVNDPVHLPTVREFAQADESGASTELGARWRPSTADCWARVENGSGWFDACYQFAQWTNDGEDAINDGDDARDFWSLVLFGTCKGKGAHQIEVCQLASKANPNAAAKPTGWINWGPRSDLDRGNCVTETISATYQGVGIGVESQVCDQWDITKYTEAGKFTNIWRGEARRSERDVAYSTIFAMNEGFAPHMIARVHFSTNGFQTVDW